jgi:pyruvate kinase
VSEAICESIAHAAEDLEMRAIAVFTESGNTARLISKYRPRTPVYAFSHITEVCNRLNLFWGVQPIFWHSARSAEDMVQGAERELLRLGKIKPGEVLGIVAGTQQTSGSTNFIRFHVVSAVEEKRPERRRQRSTFAHRKKK